MKEQQVRGRRGKGSQKLISHVAQILPARLYNAGLRNFYTPSTCTATSSTYIPPMRVKQSVWSARWRAAGTWNVNLSTIVLVPFEHIGGVPTISPKNILKDEVINVLCFLQKWTQTTNDQRWKNLLCRILRTIEHMCMHQAKRQV